MDLSGDDFNRLELIHNVLNTVYGESYPIYNIMLTVNISGFSNHTVKQNKRAKQHKIAFVCFS